MVVLKDLIDSKKALSIISLKDVKVEMAVEENRNNGNDPQQSTDVHDQGVCTMWDVPRVPSKKEPPGSYMVDGHAKIYRGYSLEQDFSEQDRQSCLSVCCFVSCDFQTPDNQYNETSQPRPSAPP